MRRKIYFLLILATIIFAVYYSAVFWHSHFGAASTINPSYKGNIVNGLVGWWTFDGATSTIANDKSGAGNNGTLSATGISQGTGKIGQGLNFDGVSSTVQVADSNSLDVTNFTLSAWVNKNTAEASKMNSIISKGSYGLKMGPDDMPYFEITKGTEGFVDVGHIGTNNVFSLAVYKGKLYAGVDITGVVYRYDGGTTWTSVGATGGAGIYSLVVYNGKLYAGTSSSGVVYRYNDDGTWTSIGSAGDSTVYALTVFNGRLYAGTQDSGNFGRVYIYNGGANWSSCGRIDQSTQIAILVSYNGSLYANGYSGSIMGLYRFNGGTSWTNVGQVVNAGIFRSAAIYNGSLYVGSALSGDARVYRYDIGVGLTDVGTFAGTAAYSLVVYNGNLYGAGTGGVINRYPGGSGTWTYVGSLDGSSTANAMTVYGGKIYAGCWNASYGKVFTIGSGEALYDSKPASGFDHIAGTYDGTTMKLWINGNVSTSTATSTTVSTNALPLFIGSSPGSSGASISEEHFNGVLDDVRVYNRALTASEMKKLYQLGAGTTVGVAPTTYEKLQKFKPGLVGLWSFNGAGNIVTATDGSGYGNNGTIYNPTPAAGKVGQGLYFNGASSSVQVADSNSLDLTTGITLSAWAKQNERSRMDSILSKGAYSLKIGQDGRPFMELISSNSNSVATVGTISGATNMATLAVWRGQIYTASTEYRDVWRYDGGTTWTSIGYAAPLATTVREIVVYNDQLYAAVSDAHVYRYDGGTTWTDVGGPYTYSGTSDAQNLTVWRGRLYVGTHNGTYGGSVYRYDGGSTWTSLGSIAQAEIYDLIVYNGQLCAGGSGLNNPVYCYDGSSWNSIGVLGASGGGVRTLGVYNGNLYGSTADGGGVYVYAGGTTWVSKGGPFLVYDFAVYNGKLYCATNGAGHLYRYDEDSTFTAIGPLGNSEQAMSLAVYDGKLFIGSNDTSANAQLFTYGNGAAVYATSTPSTGFNHLAGSYDGSMMKLWINGVLAASKTTSTTASTTAYSLLIGSSQGSGGDSLGGEENFNGMIDAVRIYNYALSAKNVAELAKWGVNTVGTTPGATSTSPLSNSAINKGLAGWWTFDGSTTGTAIDKSGNGYNAAWSATGISPVAGRVGQALKGDGVGSYMSVSSFNLSGTKIATVSFWLRRTTATGGVVIFESSSNYNNNDGAFIGGLDAGSPCAGNEIQVAIQDSVGTQKYRAECYSPQPPVGGFHHYVMIFDNSTVTGDVRLFIDGLEKTTTLAVNTKDQSSQLRNDNFYFMSRGGLSNFSPNVLDDFRVYSRILSAAEIMQLYRMGK